MNSGTFHVMGQEWRYFAREKSLVHTLHMGQLPSSNAGDTVAIAPVNNISDGFHVHPIVIPPPGGPYVPPTYFPSGVPSYTLFGVNPNTAESVGASQQGFYAGGSDWIWTGTYPAGLYHIDIMMDAGDPGNTVGMTINPPNVDVDGGSRGPVPPHTYWSGLALLTVPGTIAVGGGCLSCPVETDFRVSVIRVGDVP